MRRNDVAGPQVRLPPDAEAGEALIVTAPDGRELRVLVPDGLVPGGGGV